MTTPLRRSSPHEDKEIGTDADAAPLSALYRDLKLNIEYLPIERLENYPTNPHTHPPKQMKPLEGSIDAFGIVAPILIDEDDTVIGGHGVLAAAKQAGYVQVPVVRLKHLNEAQKKALRIGLNRIGELAGWDRKLLAIEFNNLLDFDEHRTINGDARDPAAYAALMGEERAAGSRASPLMVRCSSQTKRSPP